MVMACYQTGRNLTRISLIYGVKMILLQLHRGSLGFSILRDVAILDKIGLRCVHLKDCVCSGADIGRRFAPYALWYTKRER